MNETKYCLCSQRENNSILGGKKINQSQKQKMWRIINKILHFTTKTAVPIVQFSFEMRWKTCRSWASLDITGNICLLNTFKYYILPSPLYAKYHLHQLQKTSLFLGANGFIQFLFCFILWILFLIFHHCILISLIVISVLDGIWYADVMEFHRGRFWNTTDYWLLQTWGGSSEGTGGKGTMEGVSVQSVLTRSFHEPCDKWSS